MIIIEVFEGIVGVVEAIGAILLGYWAIKHGKEKGGDNEKPNHKD